MPERAQSRRRATTAASVGTCKMRACRDRFCCLVRVARLSAPGRCVKKDREMARNRICDFCQVRSPWKWPSPDNAYTDGRTRVSAQMPGHEYSRCPDRLRPKPTVPPPEPRRCLKCVIFYLLTIQSISYYVFRRQLSILVEIELITEPIVAQTVMKRACTHPCTHPAHPRTAASSSS